MNTANDLSYDADIGAILYKDLRILALRDEQARLRLKEEVANFHRLVEQESAIVARYVEEARDFVTTPIVVGSAGERVNILIAPELSRIWTGQRPDSISETMSICISGAT